MGSSAAGEAWDESPRQVDAHVRFYTYLLQGWYADEVHPNVKPTLTYGFLLLRFVRFFYKHLRRLSSGELVDWSSCDAEPFSSWADTET